jgi:hypothetical protein
MKNTKLIAILLTVTMLLTIAACESPAEKHIGSQGLYMSFIGYPTFEDFVLATDKIVVGKVESLEEVKEYFLEDFEDDNPYNEPRNYFGTYYNITVVETLLGDDCDSLLLGTFGTPDDVGMTKPKVGDNVLLFLHENENGTFSPTFLEMSVFIINNDNTVYSLHDDKLTAQFDGKTLDVLKKEIITILDEGDFSEKYYSLWGEEYLYEKYMERVEQHRRR